MEMLNGICHENVSLAANSLEEKCLFYEWLELKMKYYDSALESRTGQLKFLRAFNQRLKERTYLVNNRLTAMDLYFSILVSPLMLTLQPEEMEILCHLCRWYSLITSIDFHSYGILGQPCMSQYKDKFILAPMVRVGTLPMRLLALHYGADLAYTEEVIDHKLLSTTRVYNEALDTVDYVMPCGTVIFRTCSLERDKVVLQMGTANPERALKVVKLIEEDVAGVDVNMGCPKEYSTKGGMGAALLNKPDLAESILTTMVQGTTLPVTCKIRILRKLEDTLSLGRRLASTGIQAIAVHGRVKEERPRHPNHDDVIAELATALSIPVIANGGSCDSIRTSHEDLVYFKHITRASSVMVARAAMYYPAIFRPSSHDRPAPSVEEVVRNYLRLAIRYDLYLASAKYCVLQMLHTQTECEAYQQTLSAMDLESLAAVFDLSEYYTKELVAREERVAALQSVPRTPRAIKRPHSPSIGQGENEQDGSTPKEARVENVNGGEESVAPLVLNSCHTRECDLIKCLNVPVTEGEDTLMFGVFRFLRKYFPASGSSPKQRLHEFCKAQGLDAPTYYTYELPSPRLFFSACSVNGTTFVNKMGDKNKRFCEQAGACLALYKLRVDPMGCSEEGVKMLREMNTHLTHLDDVEESPVLS